MIFLEIGANSTVGRVNFGAEMGRNLGRKTNTAEFEKTPPCVDGCIKF